MTFDSSLVDQRRMLRDQWARDAALLRQRTSAHAEASLQPPAPGQQLPGDAADEGHEVRAERHIPVASGLTRSLSAVPSSRSSAPGHPGPSGSALRTCPVGSGKSCNCCTGEEWISLTSCAAATETLRR
jgi:hypothetical protein